MKTILVPTDFSGHALYALKVAVSIAKKINAEIQLVHNYSMPAVEFDNAYFYDDMIKEIKGAKKKQLNNLVCQDFLKEIKIYNHENNTGTHRFFRPCLICSESSCKHCKKNKC